MLRRHGQVRRSQLFSQAATQLLNGGSTSRLQFCDGSWKESVIASVCELLRPSPHDRSRQRPRSAPLVVYAHLHVRPVALAVHSDKCRTRKIGLTPGRGDVRAQCNLLAALYEYVCVCVCSDEETFKSSALRRMSSVKFIYAS